MCNKKGSSSKLKEVLVDEEEVLKVIENQEFIAKRTAKKIWPSPTTMEDQLRELASDGLIQHQGFAESKTPGEH
jgi:DNA-binding HxlR family transcriptional regulator